MNICILMRFIFNSLLLYLKNTGVKFECYIVGKSLEKFYVNNRENQVFHIALNLESGERINFTSLFIQFSLK